MSSDVVKPHAFIRLFPADNFTAVDEHGNPLEGTVMYEEGFRTVFLFEPEDGEPVVAYQWEKEKSKLTLEANFVYPLREWWSVGELVRSSFERLVGRYYLGRRQTFLRTKPRQNDIILAALRFYMQALEGNPVPVEAVEDIAQYSDPAPPSADEVDGVCRDLFGTA